MSKPTIKDLQEQLNMANKTVAELMEQIDELKQRLTDTTTDKMKYFNRCGEIAAINEELFQENAQLKDDLVNANSDIEKLIKSVNEVTAENYALKSEIERTNRHINLAENQLNKEQQPLVVNHYHNCVINK